MRRILQSPSKAQIRAVNNIRSEAGLDQGLIGHWVGMENGMVLRDRSIYARHAPRIGGSTWAPPRPGIQEPSMSLDYTNTYARHPQVGPAVAFPASMAVWAYWDGTNSSARKTFIMHTDYDYSPPTYVGGYGLDLWEAVGNYLELDCPNAGTSQYYSSPALIPSSGVWFFAAFACQGGTGDPVNLYLNRQTSTAQTGWGGFYPGDGSTFIVNDVIIGQHWPGYIAEAMWWTRALSAAEMLQLADPHFSLLNAPTPRTYFVSGVAPSGNPWNYYAQQ